MANKMLIDATHPEETRVVVLRGNRIDEFDFESASKKQLRGNIYLAKVIRVEPSLQAAFVDYGGNRHGFLAFSEIHPDYYQIPMSDRQALLEDEEQDEHEEEEERRPRRSRRRRGDRHAAAAAHGTDETISDADGDEEAGDQAAGNEAAGPDASGDDVLAPDSPSAEFSGDATPGAVAAKDAPAPTSVLASHDDPTADLIRHASEMHDVPADEAPSGMMPAEAAVPTHDAVASPDTSAASTHPAPAHDGIAAFDDASPATGAADEPTPSDAAVDTGSSLTSTDDDAPGERASAADDGGDADEEHVDHVGGGDALEEVPRRVHRPRRQYKIQEVIKRRQVLLVQVVKEERGNKGAAITTYLSLAGRYSVLMPNTARGGGISRKITDAGDRQRLKSIAQDLEVPQGMGVILRTAGASRSKPEVKRDFEYLMRMWETVRETTLASSAPTLVYEEGSLIKRSIRDLYNEDIDEIVVAGDDGYREAKEFMRLLTPTQVKSVQPWRDPAPLFTKAGAEAQLDAMFSSHVTLKSGGTLVINQTEALVAIDVNSGRSTREHNIEDTALRTNLEASDEVARQLRLRDLAGLIVVDFIDMEETRNNRAVERRLKEALKDDRARLQIGRISHFGLLEMSRQRMRTGVLEGSTEVCPHCAGAGTVRSTASIALHVLRVLEDALIADASRDTVVRTRGTVALYVLNYKRRHIDELEGRFGVAIAFEGDEQLTGMTYCAVERGQPASGTVRPHQQVAFDEQADDDMEELADEVVAETGAIDEQASDEPPSGDEGRRRRRRRGRGRDRATVAEDAPQPSDDALVLVAAAEEDAIADEDVASPPGDGEAAQDENRSRRRRSRRGGRRSRGPGQVDAGETTVPSPLPSVLADDGFSVAPSAADETASPLATAHDGSIAQPIVATDGLHAEVVPALDQPVPIEPASTHEELLQAGLEQPALADVPAVPLPDDAHGRDVPMVETSIAASSAAPVHPDAAAPATIPADKSDDGSAEARARRAEPVSSELDPSRPKRSGWWQRAKATLGN